MNTFLVLAAVGIAVYAARLATRAYRTRWYCPPPYEGYHNRTWWSLCPYRCGCDGRAPLDTRSS